MRSTLLATALLAAAVAVPTLARADILITDNNQTLTVDCTKHKGVSITGNRATVTLEGTCDKIMVAGNRATVRGSAVHFHVTGNNNALAIDAADQIMVTGNENTVTYKKGLKDKLPKVSALGNRNNVSPEK